MRSFLASLLATRKPLTFLRWSPCSWMTCPSSVSSTTVPLQQNSVHRNSRNERQQDLILEGKVMVCGGRQAQQVDHAGCT